VRIDLDGTGVSKLATGVPFFDHMLDQIVRHGLIDLDIDCEGDPTSTTITPSRTSASPSARPLPRRSATRRACAATATPTCRSTRRCRAWWWISPGRPGLHYNVEFTRARIGDFDVDLAREFFQGFVNHAGVTVHIDNLRGDNAHHQCETVFKAFARALRMAAEPIRARGGHHPSTKGAL
jgi:imidazoleglycerol-phosphate dehydratase